LSALVFGGVIVNNKIMKTLFVEKKKKLFFLFALSTLIIGCHLTHNYDYADGEIYLYEYKPEKFLVAKVFDIKPTRMFICVYKEEFDGQPQNLDLTFFNECPNNTEKEMKRENRGIRVSVATPINIEEFSRMSPQLLKKADVSEDEKKVATDFWNRYPETQ
jgi:hypothetical protein